MMWCSQLIVFFPLFWQARPSEQSTEPSKFSSLRPYSIRGISASTCDTVQIHILIRI